MIADSASVDSNTARGTVSLRIWDMATWELHAQYAARAPPPIKKTKTLLWLGGPGGSAWCDKFVDTVADAVYDECAMDDSIVVREDRGFQAVDVSWTWE